MADSFKWLTDHWLAIVPILWTIDQLLKLIAGLTKTTIDDNLADMLGNFLSRFFPKK